MIIVPAQLLYMFEGRFILASLFEQAGIGKAQFRVVRVRTYRTGKGGKWIVRLPGTFAVFPQDAGKRALSWHEAGMARSQLPRRGNCRVDLAGVEQGASLGVQQLGSVCAGLARLRIAGQRLVQASLAAQDVAQMDQDGRLARPRSQRAAQCLLR